MNWKCGNKCWTYQTRIIGVWNIPNDFSCHASSHEELEPFSHKNLWAWKTIEIPEVNLTPDCVHVEIYVSSCCCSLRSKNISLRIIGEQNFISINWLKLFIQFDVSMCIKTVGECEADEFAAWITKQSIQNGTSNGTRLKIDYEFFTTFQFSGKYFLLLFSFSHNFSVDRNFLFLLLVFNYEPKKNDFTAMATLPQLIICLGNSQLSSPSTSRK